MRVALGVLVGIALGFGVGWFVFGSGDSEKPSVSRAEAEQAAIRWGAYDGAECERTREGDFACKGFARQYDTNRLEAVETVIVFDRGGRPVVQGDR